SKEACTNQGQTQTQNVGGGSCSIGCGGAGGYQAGAQTANTQQGALSAAASDQNAVNANVPVSIAGGNVTGGSSNATQNADSSATTDVSNESETEQKQKLDQDFGCGCDHKDGKRDGKKDGNDGCFAGCGGAGGFQVGV